MKNILSNFVLPILCLTIIFIINNKKYEKNEIYKPEDSTVYVDINEAKKEAQDYDKEILLIFEADWSEIGRAHV